MLRVCSNRYYHVPKSSYGLPATWRFLRALKLKLQSFKFVCVEDPFSQIWLHIMLHVDVLQAMMPYTLSCKVSL